MSKKQEVSLTIMAALKAERKQAIADGTCPEWMTTGGMMMFKDAYQYKDETVRGAYQRVAKAAASALPEGVYPNAETEFFQVLWKGWLAASTPVLANTGTNRGQSVSCSGGVVGDSIYDMGQSRSEMECLTKHGFGTSYDLTKIRSRGTEISVGGQASGVITVIEDLVKSAATVSQGNNRRGAVAYYIDFECGDFDEVIKNAKENPEGNNFGWILRQDTIDKLEAGDEELGERWKDVMELKRLTGRGYFIKIDTINESNPQMYKDNNLLVRASNLCTEITLFADEDHTFTCVLSSMNLAKFDEWKDTDAVYWSTIFLDCIAELFIQNGKKLKGIEKAVRFTEKGRALGLGALGFHTYLQDNKIAMSDLGAVYANGQIFKHLKKEATRASQCMASTLGEPEWCKGYGMRNTHLIAIAPNTSSSLLCGGVSQGIEPVVANVYTQVTSAGEILRVNPSFVKLAKERGYWADEGEKSLIRGIIDNIGSVSHLDWLTDEEKQIFLTAYEIDQRILVRLLSQRQPHVCQGQSFNTFFAADEEEEYIQEVTQEAILDPNVKTLYYMRSLAGVQAAKGVCQACEG